MKTQNGTWLVCLALVSGFGLVAGCSADQANESADSVTSQEASALRRHVPETVSDAWRAVIESYPDPTAGPELPVSDDLEGWATAREAFNTRFYSAADRAAEQFRVSVVSRDLGGVHVLEITPAGWTDNGKVLVYLHGGAYVLHDARSTLASSALAAARTGLRVIAVDYTNPPQARWREVIEEVATVFKELGAQGYAMDDIALYGDSAGGGLAGGAVLKMRDDGMGMPAALVLWSPWADITETGDTYVTLRDAEPSYTYQGTLKPAADAYADPADQKHPYVSPVYGDFTPGYPPTLIQGGTKEMFLSNFVRLYQALDTAGQVVKLDLYEGMVHVFQPRLPDSPESMTALAKMKAFLEEHLSM